MLLHSQQAAERGSVRGFTRGRFICCCWGRIPARRRRFSATAATILSNAEIADQLAGLAQIRVPRVFDPVVRQGSLRSLLHHRSDQKVLRKQERWSDVPIVLLASAGATSWTTQFVSKLGTDANISIIERPVRVPTILSVLRTAKRARNRQREVQRLLVHERDSASELRNARDELEQRVKERTSELSHTNLDLTREIKERERAERDLRNLSAKVLTIQDEERRRIARDLHDGVGQTLTAAIMAVSQAISCPEPLPTGCQSGLRDVEDLLQHAVQDVRTVSHLLHPPLLDESGLLSAARWLAEGFSKRSRMKLTLELDEQTERFGQDVETGLFRILQEALTNVHRHSGAEAVHIRITSGKGRVTLGIQDDGKGIPADALRMTPNGRQGVGLSICANAARF